tara:strand:- start:462 stop:1007 length:546 start_codon:yes stop_codon:yes gene_type:complete
MNKYLELIFTFFKIGLFTFGGGYNMIPLLQNELVNEKKWITNNEFFDYVALETLVPGSISINIASFIGYNKYKFPGLLAATIGIILPSIIIITIMCYFLHNYKYNNNTKKIIFVLKPTLLALILITFIRIIDNILKIGDFTNKNKLIYLFLIISFTFVSIYFYNINPIYIILINLIIGLLF